MTTSIYTDLKCRRCEHIRDLHIKDGPCGATRVIRDPKTSRRGIVAVCDCPGYVPARQTTKRLAE